MQFSHWQISLKIAKGQFETKTSTSSSIDVGVMGKEGKATNVFLVAFFRATGQSVIIEPPKPAQQPEQAATPEPCVNCKKPTKAEVLRAVDALRDLVNRM